MLIPVAKHDVAQELAARLCQDFMPLANHAPGFSHAGIIEPRQQVANSGDTFVKGLEDFLAAGRLRKIGKFRRLCGIVLHEANCAAGDEGEMVRSEEHTSELQSRLHLVCRLLLEKKKTLFQLNSASPYHTEHPHSHI